MIASISPINFNFGKTVNNHCAVKNGGSPYPAVSRARYGGMTREEVHQQLGIPRDALVHYQGGRRLLGEMGIKRLEY